MRLLPCAPNRLHEIDSICFSGISLLTMTIRMVCYIYYITMDFILLYNVNVVGKAKLRYISYAPSTQYAYLAMPNVSESLNA